MKIQKTEKMKEQELAEILQKKEEVLKQCEEEKLKAKQWIEEQKQIIDKERKAQAKIARENRLKSNTPPIRYSKIEFIVNYSLTIFLSEKKRLKLKLFRLRFRR